MLLTGNCLQLINEIDNDIIQTIVTSPPYWGLRDYEGEEEQIGQEETPEKYVTKMVAFFSLCKPKLKDDCTVWANIGDTYFGAKGGHWEGGNSITSNETGSNYRMHRKAPPKHARLKTKDLCGVPWMFAFSMQKDGWYLRQDIIWHKPNPMPESVKDRCTKAHEYIFLFSKNKKYYYNNEAIKEEAVGERWGGNTPINMNNTKDIDNTFSGLTRPRKMVYEKRNKRSVWEVTTKPYKGAHFAVFPEELIEPCILAGSEEGDIVLDPFIGSGTTARVAKKHGRYYLGCELNKKYDSLQTERISQIQQRLC